MLSSTSNIFFFILNKMPEITKTRDRSLDVVCGIMILKVMYVHCLVSPLKTSFIGLPMLYPLLCSIAWFFFKGGMFYKDEPVGKTFKKGFKRLIVPYIVFSVLALIISILVHCCVEGTEGVPNMLTESMVHLKREGAILYNSALWFLPSMFAARLMFSVCRKLKIHPVIVAVLSLACTFCLINYFPHAGLYFGNASLGLCFFSLGFVFKNVQYDDKVFYPSLVFYLAILLYCYIDGGVQGVFSVNLHKPFFLVIFYYLVGCMALNNLFRRLDFLKFRRVLFRSLVISEFCHMAFVTMDSLRNTDCIFSHNDAASGKDF